MVQKSLKNNSKIHQSFKKGTQNQTNNLQNLTENQRKIVSKNGPKINEKSFKNHSKIDQKSFKIIPGGVLERLGSVLGRPGGLDPVFRVSWSEKDGKHGSNLAPKTEPR